MELSERWMQKFEAEGFSNVYEWQESADKVFEEHAHQGKVSLFVTDGSITYTINGVVTEVAQNQRFDIPAGVPHSAVIGDSGLIAIVGEETQN